MYRPFPERMMREDSGWGMDPIFYSIGNHYDERLRTTLRDGWYFYDEVWATPIGPYKTEWDAEKMLSLYCFDIRGCGECELLYIDFSRMSAVS